jgi:hypothetical protein
MNSEIKVVASPHTYAESIPFVKVGEHKYLVELTFNKSSFVFSGAFNKFPCDIFTMSKESAYVVNLDIAEDYPNFGQTIIACHSTKKVISELKAIGYSKLDEGSSLDCFYINVYRVYNKPSIVVLHREQSMYFYKRESKQSIEDKEDDLQSAIVSQQRTIMRAKAKLDKLLNIAQIIDSGRPL